MEVRRTYTLYANTDQKAWAKRPKASALRTHRWKVAPLYPCGREFTLHTGVSLSLDINYMNHGVAHLYSPVHSCRKFSAVLGTISLNSSIFRRPAGVSPMLTSMKTMGRVVLLLFDIVSTS